MDSIKFKNCKFYCNSKEPKNQTTNNKGKHLTIISKKEKEKNAEVKKIRADIENPFDVIKTHFKMLDELFQEFKSQQDALMTFAIG